MKYVIFFIIKIFRLKPSIYLQTNKIRLREYIYEIGIDVY